MSLEHQMPKLNPALLDPLTRIGNAGRGYRIIAREIQEIRDTLEAFKAAVEAGEVTGFKDGAMRAHDG
jgi:hypothetical protein